MKVSYCYGDYGCVDATLTMDGTAARNAYFEGTYSGHLLNLTLADDITNAVNLYKKNKVETKY